jgi:hypothetical protein
MCCSHHQVRLTIRVACSPITVASKITLSVRNPSKTCKFAA